jgi:tetratricopeptide (TPR) repeat protein
MSRPQKKRRAQPSMPQAVPKQLALQWDQADRLQQQGRLEEARDLLEELDARYPSRVEVLASLAEIYSKQKNSVAYLSVCEQVAKLRPNDPDIRLGLIGAYALNDRPALTLLAMREFLNRWPDHAEAAQMRKTLAEAEPDLLEEMAGEGLDGEEALAHGALHEEAQNLLAAGRYPSALQVSEKLLRLRPRFAPAYNNASLCQWLAGRQEAAITTSQRVLEFDPDNVHALSNLCRYLLLAGRTDEAQAMGERLRAVAAPAWEVWSKKAEALSYLGEDEAVLEALRAAEREDGGQSEISQALLRHLAGVAAMRLGRVDEARRHWQEALRRSPGMALPKENLEDSRLPAGERQGPWAFSLPYWLHPNTTRDLARRLGPAVTSGREGAIEQGVGRFVRDHPEMVALVPHLLDRGDPPGRTLALQMARSLNTPELLEALRVFALSQRGPDAARMDAAQTVSAAGLLPPGALRFWSQGEWREVMLSAYEIYTEPEEGHSPRVVELLEQAQEQLRQRDTKQAESLLQQALVIDPDARAVQQTLAAAYVLQGREAEAEALANKLHQQDPDYLFARVLLAQIYIPRGETERAKALVEPLLSRKRLHISEFAALCAAQIQFYLAEGDREAAHSWLQMWENVDPESAGVAHWRQEVNRPPRIHRLFGRR